MKLFKMEVHKAKSTRVLDVIAHADDADQAQRHVQSKFTGWQIRHCIELVVPNHFVIGEWSTD